MSFNKLKNFLRIDKNANKVATTGENLKVIPTGENIKVFPSTNKESLQDKKQTDKILKSLETTDNSSLGYIPVIPINRDLNTAKLTTLESPTQSATLENVENNLENYKKEKREKWNAYMREYMAKRRKEQKERMDKMQIVFNGESCWYKNEDIKNVLSSYINLFIAILNNNRDQIPKEIIEEINSSLESNNFIEYAFSVEEAVKTLLMQ